MKYMGSKARISRIILPLMLAQRASYQTYVEPFAGGCNSIDKVSGMRIANDINAPLIAMWDALCTGWVPPQAVSRAEYEAIRANPCAYAPELVGWVGINCSYSGKWWGGYAGVVQTKIGTTRNYYEEARRNTLAQIPALTGTRFVSGSYETLSLPQRSVIYCDPPYARTTKYSSEFDSVAFFQWVRDCAKQGHMIFVSEYEAPDDFECLWSQPVRSSLSANGKVGGSKESVEKLFVPRWKAL